MTGGEYEEMVGWIRDRWGRDEMWSRADRFHGDFTALAAVDVWAALFASVADADKARWAPRPRQLVAAAQTQARQRLDPTRQLSRPDPDPDPDPEVDGSYRAYSMAVYGEARKLWDVIVDHHRTRRDCQSRLCDIHRDSPRPDGASS